MSSREYKHSEPRIVCRCVRLDLATDQLLKVFSEQTGLSMSDLVRRFINEGLERIEEELPFDLQLQVKRIEIEEKVRSIKTVKGFMHASEKAHDMIQDLDQEMRLSKDEKALIKQHEDAIIAICNQVRQNLIPHSLRRPNQKANPNETEKQEIRKKRLVA